MEKDDLLKKKEEAIGFVMQKRIFFIVGAIAIAFIWLLVLSIGQCSNKSDASLGGQSSQELNQRAESISESRPETTGTGSITQAVAGDFGYVRNASNDGVVITYYTGRANNVTVPDTLDSLPVVGFTTNVFRRNTNLTSISLPDTITELPAEAFSGCESLGTIKLPANLVSIGNNAFYDCRSLASIDFPSGLQTIGSQAFRGTGLVTIDIPASVQTIGAGAFYELLTLVEVTINANLTSMSAGVFYNCYNLTDLTVPVSLDTFQSSWNYSTYHAFQNCHKIPLAIREQLRSQGYNDPGFINVR